MAFFLKIEGYLKYVFFCTLERYLCSVHFGMGDIFFSLLFHGSAIDTRKIVVSNIVARYYVRI